jgi:predicted ribosomally synthesized peptide with SipW-like signal peptide
MTINKRIVSSALTIGTAGALLVGATFAYFSATDTSTGNTLSTGTLNLSITDQNADTDFQTENLGTNWQPGEERLVNFDVKNTGSLPINIRGFATGTWGVSALDVQNLVKVTKVERWDGVAWDEIIANPSGITGYFYDTDNGLVGGTAFNIPAGGRSQFQLTVVLDSSAGNDFQAQTFTASLQAEAKQTNASW